MLHHAIPAEYILAMSNPKVWQLDLPSFWTMDQITGWTPSSMTTGDTDFTGVLDSMFKKMDQISDTPDTAPPPKTAPKTGAKASPKPPATAKPAGDAAMTSPTEDAPNASTPPAKASPAAAPAAAKAAAAQPAKGKGKGKASTPPATAHPADAPAAVESQGRLFVEHMSLLAFNVQALMESSMLCSSNDTNRSWLHVPSHKFDSSFRTLLVKQAW